MQEEYFTAITAKENCKLCLKNSKRNSISHPYITCSEHKKRVCYPLSINYEKFEKHIIYVVKKYVKYMQTKKFFIQFMRNIKIKHLIFEMGTRRN